MAAPLITIVPPFHHDSRSKAHEAASASSSNRGRQQNDKKSLSVASSTAPPHRGMSILEMPTDTAVTVTAKRAAAKPSHRKRHVRVLPRSLQVLPKKPKVSLEKADDTQGNTDSQARNVASSRSDRADLPAAKSNCSKSHPVESLGQVRPPPWRRNFAPTQRLSLGSILECLPPSQPPTTKNKKLGSFSTKKPKAKKALARKPKAKIPKAKIATQNTLPIASPYAAARRKSDWARKLLTMDQKNKVPVLTLAEFSEYKSLLRRRQSLSQKNDQHKEKMEESESDESSFADRKARNKRTQSSSKARSVLEVNFSVGSSGEEFTPSKSLVQRRRSSSWATPKQAKLDVSKESSSHGTIHESDKATSLATAGSGETVPQPASAGFGTAATAGANLEYARKKILPGGQERLITMVQECKFVHQDNGYTCEDRLAKRRRRVEKIPSKRNMARAVTNHFSGTNMDNIRQLDSHTNLGTKEVLPERSDDSATKGAVAIMSPVVNMESHRRPKSRSVVIEDKDLLVGAVDDQEIVTAQNRPEVNETRDSWLDGDWPTPLVVRTKENSLNSDQHQESTNEKGLAIVSFCGSEVNVTEAQRRLESTKLKDDHADWGKQENLGDGDEYKNLVKLERTTSLINRSKDGPRQVDLSITPQRKTSPCRVLKVDILALVGACGTEGNDNKTQRAVAADRLKVDKRAKAGSCVTEGDDKKTQRMGGIKRGPWKRSKPKDDDSSWTPDEELSDNNESKGFDDRESKSGSENSSNNCVRQSVHECDKSGMSLMKTWASNGLKVDNLSMLGACGKEGNVKKTQRMRVIKHGHYTDWAPEEELSDDEESNCIVAMEGMTGRETLSLAEHCGLSVMSPRKTRDLNAGQVDKLAEVGSFVDDEKTQRMLGSKSGPRKTAKSKDDDSSWTPEEEQLSDDDGSKNLGKVKGMTAREHDSHYGLRQTEHCDLEAMPSRKTMDSNGLHVDILEKVGACGTGGDDKVLVTPRRNAADGLKVDILALVGACGKLGIKRGHYADWGPDEVFLDDDEPKDLVGLDKTTSRENGSHDCRRVSEHCDLSGLSWTGKDKSLESAQATPIKGQNRYVTSPLGSEPGTMNNSFGRHAEHCSDDALNVDKSLRSAQATPTKGLNGSVASLPESGPGTMNDVDQDNPDPDLTTTSEQQNKKAYKKRKPRSDKGKKRTPRFLKPPKVKKNRRKLGFYSGQRCGNCIGCRGVKDCGKCKPCLSNLDPESTPRRLCVLKRCLKPVGGKRLRSATAMTMSKRNSEAQAASSNPIFLKTNDEDQYDVECLSFSDSVAEEMSDMEVEDDEANEIISTLRSSRSGHMPPLPCEAAATSGSPNHDEPSPTEEEGKTDTSRIDFLGSFGFPGSMASAAELARQIEEKHWSEMLDLQGEADNAASDSDDESDDGDEFIPPPPPEF